VARDDQPCEDALPCDLEQALRSSQAELESSVADQLDLEAGLAAVLGQKPASAPPAANPPPGMSFEDYVHSRAAALYGFAYALTHSRDDAAELVQETLVKVWLSWAKHAERGPVQMDRYVRAVMSNEHARRMKSHQREDLVGESWILPEETAKYDGTDELILNELRRLRAVKLAWKDRLEVENRFQPDAKDK
jgi:hypothetical protein